MTTISTSASEHPAASSPLAQLRAARRKPVAGIIGATAGLVPVGVYEVGHHELTSWSPIECPKAMIVYAGLLFSALTVLGWADQRGGERLSARAARWGTRRDRLAVEPGAGHRRCGGRDGRAIQE